MLRLFPAYRHHLQYLRSKQIKIRNINYGEKIRDKEKTKICLRKDIKTSHLQFAFRHLRRHAPGDPTRSAREDDRETTPEQQRGAAAAAGVPVRV